jgi:hypothetical protein
MNENVLKYYLRFSMLLKGVEKEKNRESRRRQMLG